MSYCQPSSHPSLSLLPSSSANPPQCTLASGDNDKCSTTCANMTTFSSTLSGHGVKVAGVCKGRYDGTPHMFFTTQNDEKDNSSTCVRGFINSGQYKGNYYWACANNLDKASSCDGDVVDCQANPNMPVCNLAATALGEQQVCKVFPSDPKAPNHLNTLACADTLDLCKNGIVT
eukprot:TRINITY_DN71607_c0_g1_i1.p1 TRINITY_DN71607_c0_g1~~TRINITY_DN71607_c0_g1_i1.p1  ORF type:complete len:174 (-),score=15.66 TRINITY_DN71607_c0_g1_i1:125-646(-)